MSRSSLGLPRSPHRKLRSAAASTLLTVVFLLSVSGTSWSQQQTTRSDDARIDPATGTARAIYRPRFEKPGDGAPDEVARAFLRSEPRIGWDGDSETLRLVETVESAGGRHVTYQQFVDDIPVLGGLTRVSLDRKSNPTFVSSGYRPELVRGAPLKPLIDGSAAENLAAEAVEGGEALAGQTSLAVLPGEPARLVWKTIVWPEIGGEWQVLIDAVSAEVVSVDELTLHRSIRERRHEEGRLIGRLGALSPQRAPSLARVQTTGNGMVFDPDPLATSGMPYAPPYTDSDDADVPELNAERISVDLPDISQFADTRYRLAGPHVQVVGRRPFGVANYDPPAELDPEAFTYTRGDERFEAVMVYYHIDRSQRHVQSLGFDNIQNLPIEVNPFGEGDADVSNYYLNQNFLAFGGGSVDDAEDAFVIWHEYAHALLNATVPNFTSTFEGKAIHEGWADYWASSYQRELFEAGVLPAGDWRRLFRWDGNFPHWQGRRLPEFSRYPDDLIASNHHNSGLVIASALMAAWDHLGRDLTDEITLQSHFYLTNSATMPDLAEAFVQADIDLYGGQHADVIVAVFAERGLVDAESYGPIITHEPIGDTEQVGGVIDVVAQVSGVIDPIRSATLTYIIDGVETTSEMVAEGDGNWSAKISLPPTPTLVDYYIVAVDENGREVRFPDGAPNEVVHFQAGPDTEAPAIEHIPIAQTSVLGWPPTINATIVDNIGIDSAYVEYAIDDLDLGSSVDAGRFALEYDGNRYTGRFPELVGLIDGNEVVRYRIVAVDFSTAANKAVVPPAVEPAFEFRVSAQGTVASFDFEGSSDDVISTGAWEHGNPSLGVHFAHSGSDVWATGLGRAYPDFPGSAELVLPAFNLSGLSFAWLEFWHWYDVEHDGTAIPGSDVNANLWDGAVVQVSTDGGASWSSVTPEGGYDGTVESGAGNPLEGQEAFGGFSYGWRREVAMIPGGPDVRVRFVFGHDVSNEEIARDYAGWMIDDVSIRVDRPRDDETPRIIEEPPAVFEAEAGSPIGPEVRIRVGDNVGVGSVEAFYELTGPVAQESGSARLAQSGTDPELFSGRLPIAAGLTSPGSTVTYRVSVGDFDGNSVDAPAGGTLYRIEYVFVAREDQLASVTASGGWEPEGALGWSLSSEAYTGGVSALVFTPFDLPTDAADVRFELTHDYRLAPPVEANLQVSTDGGTTWRLIEPVGGYPVAQTGFQGRSAGESSVFTLNQHAGEQVRLRIELKSSEELAENDYWHIGQATTVFKAEGDRFTIPRTLELHPNFPNPFTDATTLSYTIPEQSVVRIEVYDLLGRRVAQIVDEPMEAGTYSTRWEAGGLAGGTYLVRLETKSGRDVKTVSVIR